METRWIVLAADGRHVTMGRHTDPSQLEIEEAERGLASQGLSGWLAVMKGAYFSRQTPSLMMVRPLANPVIPFDDAAAAFIERRTVSLAEVAD